MDILNQQQHAQNQNEQLDKTEFLREARNRGDAMSAPISMEDHKGTRDTTVTVEVINPALRIREVDGFEILEPASDLTYDSDYVVMDDAEFYKSGAPSIYDSKAHHLNTQTGEVKRLKETEGTKTKFRKALNLSTKPSVEKQPGQIPRQNELVEQGQTPVKQQQGSFSKPNVSHELIPNTLFIDGRAQEEDIRQANIGDCYFLSALLQVLRHDPSIFPKLMEVHDGVVTTSFYRKEQVPGSVPGAFRDRWVIQPVEVSFGILEREMKKDKQQKYSSCFRVAYNPQTSVWSADIQNKTLKINRKDMYEAAMWVACIEQAYMIFARQFGKYGDQERDETPANLVHNFEGGFSNQCMSLFFGAKAYDSESEHLHNVLSKGDRQTVESNRSIIKLFKEYEQSFDGNNRDGLYLSVSIKESRNRKRLLDRANKALRDISIFESRGKIPGLKSVKKRVSAIHEIAKDILDETNKIEDSQTALKDVRISEKEVKHHKARIKRHEAKRTALIKTLDKTSAELQKAYVEFQRANAQNRLTLVTMQPLREAIGAVVQRTEAPNKPANIFMYAAHAYAVHTVTLVDANGQSVANLPLNDLIDRVDANRSTVTLQNPHAMNKPALNEVDDRYCDGKFTLSLKSFLNNVDTVRYARVSR